MGERLFIFVQMEFPWVLGPPDGRYLLRGEDDAGLPGGGQPEGPKVPGGPGEPWWRRLTFWRVLKYLAIAIVARYVRHMAGAWRKTYVITAVIAQYFNCFVLVVQLFLKVPALKAMAPTQSEPPFLIAQVALMILFIVLGYRAAVKFRA